MSFNIGQALRRIFRACPAVSHLFVPVIRLKDLLDGRPMHTELDKTIRIFCKPEEMENPAHIRRLKRDMWYSFLQYHCGFDEYFQFQFPRLSHQGRREFITDYERVAVCQPMTDPDMMALFKNKWNTYQYLREFYGREAILVDKNADFADFCRYLDAHPSIIVKPLEESCGIGIRLIRVTPDLNREELFHQLQQEGVILEERIEQSEIFSQLHPASVNTVRFATFMQNETVHTLFAFLRIGQKNAVVDNAGSGGLFATIDMETGIVETPAVTEFGDCTGFHPDTHVQIIGMAIPRWDELKETASRLARKVPAQKYVSWDLALTDQGWVLVEGNCMGQFVSQIPSCRGLRAQLSPFFPLQ